MLCVSGITSCVCCYRLVFAALLSTSCFYWLFNEYILILLSYFLYCKLQVIENIYPYQSPRTLEEKLEDEILYLVNRYSSMRFEVDEERDMPYREVPLAYVVNAPRIACISNDSAIIR